MFINPLLYDSNKYLGLCIKFRGGADFESRSAKATITPPSCVRVPRRSECVCFALSLKIEEPFCREIDREHFKYRFLKRPYVTL